MKITGKQISRQSKGEHLSQPSMHERFTKHQQYAKRMVRLRSSTVEPVLGTLINFRNMKRVHTRGIQQANKHVPVAAITYNLHKYIRLITQNRKRAINAMH
ncbi:MAG: transposase [Chitinophagales bacterium]